MENIRWRRLQDVTEQLMDVRQLLGRHSSSVMSADSAIIHLSAPLFCLFISKR